MVDHQSGHIIPLAYPQHLMDGQTNTSKYVIGALVAIGLIALLIAFNVGDDDTERDDLDRELAACEEDLAELNTRLATATRTPELERELQDLIERCSDVVENARADR